VDAWLKKRNYNGVLRVFGWSFYSQGTHETQTSSGAFFEKVLPFFGYDLQANPLTDDTAKGRQLAELLRKQSSLLVLDGIEPLQNRVEVNKGRLKDFGLYALLRDVEKHGLAENSLVIVSSRQALVELENCSSYEQVDLHRLDKDDGVGLLRALNVNGLQHEFETAVEAYGGHALALVLLGKLLVEYFDGDVNQHKRLPILEESEETVVGHHVERVMRFYEYLWAADVPERCFLNLLGLFDRPMDKAAMDALFKSADIAKPLDKLSNWKKMLAHLRKTSLLLEEKQIDEISYDTHPLIRRYFGKQLQTQNLSAWQQAHLVLFEHFKKVPATEQPDTLKELEPLYRAVHHGCLAGEYQSARDVFQHRICRDSEGYSTNKLGAFASDLAILADFFPPEQRWTKPVSKNLLQSDRRWLLGLASFCLMSMGQLEDSIEARKADLEIGSDMGEQFNNWVEAIISAKELTNLHLHFGNLSKAEETAQKAIKWSDKADFFNRMLSRTIFAVTLHRLGNLSDSELTFQKAEEFQKQQPQPKRPELIYHLSAIHYCAFLLDRNSDEEKLKEILKRLERAFRIQSDNNWLLDKALNHFLKGRALTALGEFKESEIALNEAVKEIRKANITFTPEVILGRANFYRQRGHIEQAQQDLEEVREIIAPSGSSRGMKLYEAEADLLHGHLLLDQKDLKEAEKVYKRAEERINQMKYGLRTAEVFLLATRLAHYNKRTDEARQHLEAAKKRIEKIGQYGLMGEWERVCREIGECDFTYR
jgi:tetratricopeptide (TPR) repeat protein